MISIIIRYLGYMFIMMSNGGFMYLMLNYYVPWTGLTKYWVYPCVIASLIGLFIALPFLIIFNISSETIIMCLIIDSEQRRPRHLRPQIMKYFLAKEDYEDKDLEIV